MPQNKPGTGDQDKPGAKPGGAPLQPMGESVPALVEGAKPEVVYYKPESDQDVPKGRFGRWFYHRAQIVLSVLTFLVVIIYAVQLWEVRNTREIENRAYVTTRTVVLTSDPAIPDFNFVMVTVVNTGRTPGLNGGIVGQLERREASPPENTVVNPPEQPSSKMLFGPSIDMNKGVGIMAAVKPPEPPPIQNSGNVVTPSKSGKAAPSNQPNSAPAQQPAPVQNPADARLWYVFGVITYEDVFGKSHQTKFCYRNAPGTAMWWLCPTYNDAN
jgi:hypothetical protein